MTTPEVLLVADGASAHTRRLARALVERHVAVELATFEPAMVPGVIEHRLGQRPVADDQRYALAIPRLARLIASRRPRVVHAHYISSYGLLAAIARRAAGTRTRLVQTAWGTDLLVTARRSRLRAALAAFALRSADLATADSDDLLAEVARLAPATPRQRFVFGPPRALLERPRTGGERLVLSSRRLEAPMRVPLVVRAFRRARELDPVALAGWRLAVAADGADAAAVREAAGDDPAVELHGMLDQERLHALLLGARIFVSVPDSDATSAALLEALGAGALPVVNDLPANREWVDDRVGIVVSRDPGPEELARAIAIAASREPDVDAIRSRARPAAWEEQVDALIASYRAL